MSLKESITNWLGKVKDAIHSDSELRKFGEECIKAKYDIIALESLDERPNISLEQCLGSKYCKIKYCPEDALWGSLYEEDNRTIHMCCQHFSDHKKCKNTTCPAIMANHKYFDMQKEYENKRQEHKNNVRRVFGIKTK